jgi:hypothetical protein
LISHKVRLATVRSVISQSKMSFFLPDRTQSL